MRTLLVTGPGGAGTTTVATAAAARFAGEGRRTALLTRQHLPLPDAEQVPGLRVERVSGARAAEGVWAARADALGGLLPHLALPPASSVVPLPGADALALLAALGRADEEVVVVDAGPLGDGLAFAGLPGVLRWWLAQALPPTVRALAAVRTATVAAGTVRRGPLDVLLDVVPPVERLLAADRLADPTSTALWLVAEARAAAVPALRRAVPVLALHGLRPTALVTRTLPEGGTGEWWAARTAEQATALDSLAELGPLQTVPELAGGPADLADVLALLAGVPLPVAGGPPPPAPRRHGGGWQLTIPLPFAERAAVGLTRWGDDLVVGVGEDRRSLRLDSLLRRCEVTGGRLADPRTADARLEISFRPDPQQWPADLLSAEGRNG